MDQTLLKYWKTCLQDAERKAIALKGPRITLNIGDKILKFIPLKSIPVIFPDWKYNPQNEMFRLLGTKRSFSQNETFFFSPPCPPTLPFSA